MGLSPDTDLIRRTERGIPETPFDGGTLSDAERVIYSALLASDTDQYFDQPRDLPRRAKAVAVLLGLGVAAV